MSIEISIALFSYLLGVVIQWVGFRPKFRELDEYTNFPIIWAAKIVTMIGCFMEALTWPYSLILENELILEKNETK
ncbi:hypothetical protein [Brasilonema bromeliae]|uniref:Uncharacterized protein n=1 Tax=Brasilonema bromeliae SPC951 TaxID=385972 RepID=A0ABX1PAV1_9CYAN|nr:hypothetical protein [Brasilonema bromeliae]NMG21565.1 hypothetical protein [Brasilonema bromeliae SPC951]